MLLCSIMKLYCLSRGNYPDICVVFTLSEVIIKFLLSFVVSNGHVKRLQDDDIQSNVLEIVGSNVQSTFITCPADPNATLGIKLPFLVVIAKNVNKYFTFEIQVLDDKNVRRRFRASNFQVCKSTLCLLFDLYSI